MRWQNKIKKEPNEGETKIEKLNIKPRKVIKITGKITKISRKKKGLNYEKENN
jgi:hypothetical protein